MAALMIMSLVILAWLAVVGGCIGSFLNVVVYRLPRGENIVHPGSRCPRCGHAIRWFHNLPVIGWLLLRGRCHDCRQPIAARYPLVEALVAVSFFLLGLLVFSRPQNPPPDSLQQWPLWAVYVSFAGLYCALLCAILIRYDGHRVPRSIWWAAAVFAAGLTASAVF